VHAAVEMTSRSIGEMDLESFQRACHAKALGGWVLNQMTLQMELDFFVLFSSVAGLWGAAGLGHYAAACQSLDLLAQWRRQRGLRALSVNWGAWQEVRAASEADKEQYLKSGLHSMPNGQALAALGNTSFQRIGLQQSWRRSIGARWALFTKHAERGLC
jgi:KR domain